MQQMQAAAAPAPAPRHRVYTAVDPRCEWARTVDADTLVVDVSGFRKEELRVLYNTSRKLRVTGERLVGNGGGARWARFLKSFPVPRSIRTEGIRAVMDKDEAILCVILPKGSPSPPGPPPPPPPPPPSSSMATQKEQQPGSALPMPHGEQKGGTGNADGSAGSSGGGFWSAQEDAEKNKTEENKMVPKETRIQIQEENVTSDAPRTDGGADANAVKKDDGGENKRWWEKITPLHVFGIVVLVLALVGVGALYAALLL